jgi:formylglycine-generating enzyme required for sulfatase activity/serine/threonine protein kinase
VTDPDPPARAAAGSAAQDGGADAEASTVVLRARGTSRLPVTHDVPEKRYELGAHLASGGQGDIYRVFDRQLRRHMVMKLLAREWIDDPVSLARFVAEAQVTAQLQHPSIVPVHEIGTLPDGRPYYTMAEVRGRTLAAVIEAVHGIAGPDWGIEPGGFGFRRLIDVFHRVCEAVAYAHSRTVIHRDLKPLNIMVGAFGEALVLDWGLAHLGGVPGTAAQVAEVPTTSRTSDASLVTVAGAISGTMGYMSPEQAAGEPSSTRSDVYALGMMLREILTGHPPGLAETMGSPTPIQELLRRPVPGELLAICARATAVEPGERYGDASELAQALAGFLDGARKRERALALLAEARAVVPRIAALKAQAGELAQKARAVLDPLPPSADSALKEVGWALDDRVRELRVEADLATFEMTRLVESSLVEADLPEAHAMIAQHVRALHEDAELAQDASARTLEVQLRAHDRGEHAAYLAGTGALTLRTEPPAAIELRRYEMRGRRLIDEHVRHLGTAPLDAIELPRGSYLLVLRAPGCHDVRYPVAIGRQEHWDPRRPGEQAPHVVVLPPLASIGDDECYVPGGPFVCGGDPLAAGEVLPRQRVWVDSFVVQRQPITNRELLEMVNALIDERDPRAEALALGVVPRHRGTSAGEAGTLIWPRDADGHFRLGSDDEGLAWEPRVPAFMVSWPGAMAYAAWLGRRTGRPYRLPGELELEKAARGVDARAFPWGDFFDPTWACMRQSHDTALRPVAVDAFPVDDSPYGVRHLAGNVVEWCADEYRREGPPLRDGLYVPPLGLTADAPACDRTLRGGCFLFDSFLLRSATRHSTPSVVRDVSLGFRLVRSCPT